MGNQESKGNKHKDLMNGNTTNKLNNNIEVNQFNYNQNLNNGNQFNNGSTSSSSSYGNTANNFRNNNSTGSNGLTGNNSNQGFNNQQININNQSQLSQSVYINQNQNSHSPNLIAKDSIINSNTNINSTLTQSSNLVNEYLNKAYSQFNEGNGLFKQFSFYDALFKFEEAQKLTTHIYQQIQDDQLKLKVDMFLKTVASQIDLTNFQIKNQFEYKKTAGFASKADEKQTTDYLASFRTKNNNSKYVDAGNSNSNYNNDKERNITKNQNYSNSNNSKEQNNNNSDNIDNKNDKNQTITSDLKAKILSEIVDSKPGVKFTDVIGLAQAKQILKEIIVLPNLRPDLFTGLRSPPRGLLLFGPPGVGKTLIAKAVATECACTFFNISASALTSKYLGESEKLVRTLFELAYEKQPSVVFIDEIESILSKRSDNENEASKRLKTEFLIQFDGVGSDQKARVLIIGATNRPFDLDTAVLRRLPKRIYIGAFNKAERIAFIIELLKNNPYNINDQEFDFIGSLTENYSNSDLRELCREAAYEPIREISDFNNLSNVSNLRPTIYSDFLKAAKVVRGTLNAQLLTELKDWNSQYGAIN